MSQGESPHTRILQIQLGHSIEAKGHLRPRVAGVKSVWSKDELQITYQGRRELLKDEEAGVI